MLQISLFFTLVYTKPLLRDLYQYITPRYGAYWEVIGELLGLQTGALRIIEAEWPTNIERCCNKMLKKWLDIDITASWQKMFAAIESPAVLCFDPHRGEINDIVYLVSYM